MYVHLINWKWKHITEKPGINHYKGKAIEYDAILPEEVRKDSPLIYPPILKDLKEHKKQFDFKFHAHFNHMASSQAANVNLFLPILLSPKVNEILRKQKPDFKRLATDKLYKGFRIEFWDGNSSQEKGLLGDHNSSTGTDSDMAIAYYNHEEELCLWLIEHKLTEAEFTTCGGAKSKGRKTHHSCDMSFKDILKNKDTCYYHSANHYQYWNLTEKHQKFFANANEGHVCLFKKGMNQLWRNQLLALELEDSGEYKDVFFSVVHHPDNDDLDESLKEYKELIADNRKFSVFTSKELVESSQKNGDRVLYEWVDWYKNLYNI
ncbi:MAG: hypothetical protein R2799_16555 [Crocinitomicaceae bacterium]